MKYEVKVKDSNPLPFMIEPYYWLEVEAPDEETAKALAQDYAQDDRIISIKKI